MYGRDGHKNAIQYSDMMMCDWCGRQWDTNDPTPPPCEPHFTNAAPKKPGLKTQAERKAFVDGLLHRDRT